MRKTQRKAATATKPNRLVSNTMSGLPNGLGSLHFRNGSYWMIYRDAEGNRAQVNTHSKNLTAARVMLAERVLTNITALTAHLEGVIHEGTAALTEAGFMRLADGSFAGTSTEDRYERGTRRVGRGNQAASRDHRGTEVKA